MIIAGFLPQSLVDFPGRISAVVFTQGCNFNCPFCHNSHLIPLRKISAYSEDYIIRHLKENHGLIDGITISGGEPTIHRDLPDFLRRVRDIDVAIKIDTNGTNPEMIDYLISHDLVDYIAMDFKAPPRVENYTRAAGVVVDDSLLNKILRTRDIIISSGIKHEFRTTLVPEILTLDDLLEINRALSGSLHCIQQFIPENANHPKFRNIKPYSMDRIREITAGWRNVIIREY